MPLRMIEIIAPEDKRQELTDALEKWRENRELRYWTDAVDNDWVRVKTIVNSGQSEALLDQVEQRLPLGEDFRIVVSSVEATLPHLPEVEEQKETGESAAGPDNGRISREELYHEVVDMAALTRRYAVMVALSTVVAAIGLLTDNVAVLIGSMVIAPLLGPNMGLILAAALGDTKLFRSALLTVAGGMAVALAVAAPVGYFAPPGPQSETFALLTRLDFPDLALALASGTAGVLSLTMGVASAAVGVMVALALLPPLTAAGILLGAGRPLEAGLAALLFLSNVICLNLAGVATLAVQGVRPRQWWEQKKARRATWRALGFWLFLLAALAGALYLQRLL